VTPEPISFSTLQAHVGRKLPVERWGRALLEAVRARAGRSALAQGVLEFLMFGLKQGWACLFGGLMLAALLLTHMVYPDHAAIARYDLMVFVALFIQAAMLLARLERWSEVAVILIFHVAGTAMEVFKVHMGSWTYPEPGFLKIAGVPLFSGFMYSAVGSYIARIIRIMDIGFIRYPPEWAMWGLAIAVYANFFTHHFVPDLRLGLFALCALLMWRSGFQFTPDLKPRRMPMLLGVFLVALFIWFAENLSTFSHVWIYPAQRAHWTWVQPEKLGSWFLLILLSFVLVTLVHRPRSVHEAVTGPRHRVV
jgi:uncharacterized membrane protein YoaT (DUF817 family)